MRSRLYILGSFSVACCDRHGSMEMSKNLQVAITKLHDKVVAVTMVDDEHRIAEVLWQAPKPLSDEEITYQFQYKCPRFSRLDIFKYAVKWAEERHGIK